MSGEANVANTIPQDRRIIDTLLRVGNFLSEVTDLKRLLTLIMDESKETLDSEASSCMLYDDATDELFFEVALGEKGDQIKAIRLKRGQGFGGICLAEGRTLLVNDVGADERHDTRADCKAQFVTRNLIATPMRYLGKTIGVLEVLNKREGALYDSQDMRILQLIADRAAMALAYAQLVESNIQSERLAAAGLAVNSIAHHLKNLIMGVKAPLSLIRMGIESDNAELLAKSLPIVERSALRMEQSVGEMLTFSRKREPERVWENLSDLIEQIVAESLPRARAKNVEIRYEIDPSIGPSALDASRLYEAALNIVGNAIEAHSQEAQDAWVEIRARLRDDIHVIEIEDNGPGIPAETLRHIFEPFYSTKGSKGTGLGLSVARKIAEENGGSLTARSVEGQGTAFTFRLPVILDEPSNG